jgi:hypothetical protein
MPADYVARVKEMHEQGGHGSIGYRFELRSLCVCVCVCVRVC